MRHRPLIRRSTIALSILAIAAVPALSGCFNGHEATTTTQASMNTGDGVQTQIGNIKVVNVTLVMGEPGSDAMLIGTIANVGITPDAVNGIEVAGKPVTPAPAFSELTAGNSVDFGYANAEIKVPVSGLTAPVSSYVPVSFQFQNAGNTTISVLTVPAVGQYEGIVPLASTPSQSATPAPTLVDTPTAEASPAEG